MLPWLVFMAQVSRLLLICLLLMIHRLQVNKILGLAWFSTGMLLRPLGIVLLNPSLGFQTISTRKQAHSLIFQEQIYL